jgi:hypothetical protein
MSQIFKGFKQVVEGEFSPENGYLYLVRTNDTKTDGYFYFNGKKYGTAEIAKAEAISTAKEMIETATKRIDGGIINSGNNSTVNAIGEITENNDILINEDMLPAGTYTLKYLDGNDNVVSNSKPITNFTI